MSRKLCLLLISTSFFLYSCKKTDSIKPGNTDNTTATKPDTTITFKNDTLFTSWQDTVLKVVKDAQYNTKRDTLFKTQQGLVVLIKRIVPKSSKTAIFFLGTSITFGSESADGVSVPVAANQNYPAVVSGFFSGDAAYGGWYNYGLPGAVVNDIINTELPSVLNVDLTGYSNSAALIEEGINDFASGYAARDIYNNIKNSHNLLHQKGVQTIVVTPTPFNSNLHTFNHDAATAEAIRQQLKAMLINGWKNDIGAIALIDLADDSRVGKYSGNSGFDLAIFQPDGIHFTPLGYRIIAGQVARTVFYLK